MKPGKSRWSLLKAAMNDKWSVDHEKAEFPTLLLDDWLYIGDMYHAKTWAVLQQLNITHGSDHLFFKDQIIYCNEIKGVRDSPDYDISRYFDLANEFIDRARAASGRVLIHCAAGISRSATISIAYLIARNRWSAASAFAYCQQRRRQIAPNPGFQQQLVDYACKQQAINTPTGLFPALIQFLLFMDQVKRIAPVLSRSMDVAELYLSLPASERNVNQLIDVIASTHHSNLLYHIQHLVAVLYQKGILSRDQMSSVCIAAKLDDLLLQPEPISRTY